MTKQSNPQSRSRCDIFPVRYCWLLIVRHQAQRQPGTRSTFQPRRDLLSQGVLCLFKIGHENHAKAFETTKTSGPFRLSHSIIITGLMSPDTVKVPSLEVKSYSGYPHRISVQLLRGE